MLFGSKNQRRGIRMSDAEPLASGYESEFWRGIGVLKPMIEDGLEEDVMNIA